MALGRSLMGTMDAGGVEDSHEECHTVKKREVNLVYDFQCLNEHLFLSPFAGQNYLRSLLNTPIPELHPQRYWFNCSWVGSRYYSFLSSPSDSNGQPAFRTDDLEDGGTEGGNGNALTAATRRINVRPTHQVLGGAGALLLLHLLSLGHICRQYRKSRGRGTSTSRIGKLLLIFK